MQRAVGISSLIGAIFIPLCIWGMVSALTLHLIEIRSIFIEGGENRLRLATLAFAAGVVLVQRLSAQEGKSTASAYAWALGAVITMFAMHNAYAYRLPVHPMIVFAFNQAIFMTLWWVGRKLTATCSVDSDVQITAAADAGIFSTFGRGARRGEGPKKRKEFDPFADPEQTALAEAAEAAKLEKDKEQLWTKRLPANHPGRMIFYFSLVAVPAFGLGVYLFSPDSQGRFYLGALLFVYIWCAISLLFLSSLAQVRAYFVTRGVTLPEQIGIPWLGLGFALVSLAVIAAFLLPQPATTSGLYVRDSIVSVYHGWESSRGINDSVGGPESEMKAHRSSDAGKNGSSGNDRMTHERVDQIMAERGKAVEGTGDEYAQSVHKAEGGRYENYLRLRADANETLGKVMSVVVKVVLVIGGIAALIVIYILLMSFIRSAREGMAGLVWRRGKKVRKRRKKKRRPGEPEFEPVRFRKFADPFLGSHALSDGDAIVRYLWEAMLAYCADGGAPCAPDQTPREFVESGAEPLDGFEAPARFIADIFTFSEYSSQPIPEAMFPELKRFWSDLARHAGALG